MLREIKRMLNGLLRNKSEVFIYQDNQKTDLLIGTALSKISRLNNNLNWHDYEFKVFSQWGDDGLIQYLIYNICIKNPMFIEFGVENYEESTTRFLMMNNNWSGYILDGSKENIEHIKQQPYYWMYQLEAVNTWITKDNINSVLGRSDMEDIGLLHIDIDGNDYHIFKEINLEKLNPSIIILEYNGLFGGTRKITVPYKSDFNRTCEHHSNLYFGASLSALNDEAEKKGYSLVGCTLAGNNSYFVRNDLLNEIVQKKSVAQAFVNSKFREGRNVDGDLTYLSGNSRYECIKGLEVLNIDTNRLELL